MQHLEGVVTIEVVGMNTHYYDQIIGARLRTEY